jgi:ABC-2 type transport system permease protein
MNLRRVGVLLGKEFIQGPKNFIFIFAVVTPLIISLVVSLLFGTLFSGKPQLGLFDEGNSQIVRRVAELDFLVLREYASTGELKQAVGAGTVDLGFVLPVDLDDSVGAGKRVELTAYVWGESLLKDRAILATAITSLLREMTGEEPLVEILTTVVGDTENVPWEERLLPFVVLMAIVLSGSIVPATSLVDEKQKRTLKALVITPTSTGEVYLVKGLLGGILSIVTGIVILALNRAFGAQAPLLILVLTLSAIMAAAYGVLLGSLIKDINTLFTIIKGTGLFLYAPAIVYLFPQIPQWVGRLFPTYYMLAPIIEISQRAATWSDISLEVSILIGLILVLIGVVAFVAYRPGRAEN